MTRGLQAQYLLQPRPVEADHYFLVGFAPDHGDRRGHRPHALQLGQCARVLGYVSGGERNALLAEELLRSVAEQSAGFLHEQYDPVFSRQWSVPLLRSVTPAL